MTTRCAGAHGPDAPAERQPAAARAPRSRPGDRCRRTAGSDRRRPSRRACAARCTRTRPASVATASTPGWPSAPTSSGKEADRGRVRHQRARRRRAPRRPASRARAPPPALRVQRAARRGLLVVDDDARARRGAGDLARGARPAGPPPITQASTHLVRRRRWRARRVVRQRARAAHLAHHLQEHRVAGPAARHQRVVVHAARETASRRRRAGRRRRWGRRSAARRPARPAPAPCRPAGWAARRCAWCRRRSARRGRTGRAGGGTWSTGRACGCRPRTAPPRPARPRAPAPASPRSRSSPAAPDGGAPAKPRRVVFHARHSTKVASHAGCLTFRVVAGSGTGPVLVDDDLL